MPRRSHDAEMMRIATFVSRGQVDMTTFLDYETRTVNAGDLERGRAIFQTVCAACHGFDGRLLDWSDRSLLAQIWKRQHAFNRPFYATRTPTGLY